MPEWSKGVDLRSTVYVRVGSNPTPSTSDPIAQWLERWSYEPKVVGSSPTGSICSRSVVVSTEDFDSSVPGSNPGGNFF